MKAVNVPPPTKCSFMDTRLDSVIPERKQRLLNGCGWCEMLLKYYSWCSTVNVLIRVYYESYIYWRFRE